MDDEKEKPKFPKSTPPSISVGFPSARFDQKKRDLGNISSDADGILTRLYRNIVYDLTNNQWYSTIAWRKMMEAYLDEMVASDPNVSRQNVRGNFTKALNASKMSWKTFVKAMKLQRFRKFRIILIGTRDDDTVSVHSTTVALRSKKGEVDTDVEAIINILEESVRDAIREQNNKGKKQKDADEED